MTRACVCVVLICVWYDVIVDWWDMHMISMLSEGLIVKVSDTLPQLWRLAFRALDDVKVRFFFQSYNS